MGGSFGRGIFLYASNGKRLKEFNTYLNFPSNTINQILKTQKDVYGLQQEKVLSKSRTVHLGNIRSTSAMRGLANTFIWAIEEDENQNIWFSTNQGISCFVEMKKISTITISGTIFQWQVSPGRSV